TYEMTSGQGGGGMPGMQVFVFSRTLRAEDCAGVTLSTNPAEVVAALKREPGKDIWLFGCGELVRSMLEATLVDAIDVARISVRLGGGLPLLPHPATRTKLRLVRHRIYPKTGTVSLKYRPA